MSHSRRSFQNKRIRRPWQRVDFEGRRCCHYQRRQIIYNREGGRRGGWERFSVFGLVFILIIVYYVESMWKSKGK